MRKLRNVLIIYLLVLGWAGNTQSMPKYAQLSIYKVIIEIGTCFSDRGHGEIISLENIYDKSARFSQTDFYLHFFLDKHAYLFPGTIFKTKLK